MVLWSWCCCGHAYKITANEFQARRWFDQIQKGELPEANEEGYENVELIKIDWQGNAEVLEAA